MRQGGTKLLSVVCVAFAVLCPYPLIAQVCSKRPVELLAVKRATRLYEVRSGRLVTTQILNRPNFSCRNYATRIQFRHLSCGVQIRSSCSPWKHIFRMGRVW